MAFKEQGKPLAPGISAEAVIYPVSIAPAAAYEPDVARGYRSGQYLRKRRYLLWCCGCFGLTVVILGITILILALTIFKVKDPELTMNNIYYDTFDAGIGTIEHPVSMNVSLIADVSIKNPNVAGFSFDNSTTEFYHNMEIVGVAYAPYGEVPADRTFRGNVSVDVLVDRLQNVTVGGLVVGTILNLSSFTDVTGRVNVLGIYKRDLEVTINCTMTLNISAIDGYQEVQNRVCGANVN